MLYFAMFRVDISVIHLLLLCTYQLLVGYIEDCLKGGNLIEEVGLHPNTAGERGLKLLVVSI
jgi:sister-chromatid-cohesion protein PDS5